MTDHIHNRAAALCRLGDRLLIGRRRLDPHQGLWVIPEGDVRLYESSRAAVARDLLDAAGVVATIGDIAFNVEIVDRARGDHQHIVVYHALATTDGIEPGQDLDDVRWASAADLALMARTHLLTPTVSELLAKAGWIS